MKSRFALTLALLTALMAPAAAAVTTKYTLSNASWTDLGAGPMLLGFSGTGVYAIADTTPSIPKSEGFTMIAGESAQVATSSHVWAMAKDSPGVLAYVGPYDAPSGTSSGGGVVQQGAVDATAAPWQIDTLATGNLINAIKGAIPAGTNVIGYVSGDPCAQNIKLAAPFAITSAIQTQLAAAPGGTKRTYICAISMITGLANNVNIYDTAGACTLAATDAVIGPASNAATNGFNFAANGGLTFGTGAGTVAFTATVNTTLCVVTSSAGPLSGVLTYVQQ